MAPAAPIIAAVAASIGAATSIVMGVGASIAAGREAEAAEQAGQLEAERTRRQGRREGSALRARFGALSTQVGSGTPLAVLADKAAETEEEALLAIMQGGNVASRLRTQGDLALASGILGGLQGFASAASYGYQASTILGGPTVPSAPKALGPTLGYDW